ncbi:MAG: hypothetical protein V9G18_00320 [Albidovulum sp.]
MPDAPAPATKREIVARLASDIRSARSKGYTLKAIARHLRDRGFDINYNTLRDALPRQKKSRSGKKKPRAVAMADGARTGRDGPMTGCDGHGTGRDGTAMRVVAPSVAPATREVAPARSSRGAPDEPGRDAIPPGAFARRPDLKDL